MKFLDCIQISPPVSLVKGKIYSFIEMANVSTVFREPDYIDVKAFSSGTKFEDGDTVIARIEPCLQNGKRFFVKGIGKGFGSTEFLVFRPKTIDVDNKYLYYFMKTEYIQQLMVSSMTGATGRQRVNNDIFSDLEISLPDLPTQRRIASILSAYDDLIENNRRQINLLEEAAQRLYREWFVELRFPGHESVKVVDGVPEGWTVTTASEVTNVLRRGISPNYDETARLSVISQKCIRQYMVDMNQVRRQSKSFDSSMGLLDSDTVICSTGTGTLGRVGKVFGNHPNCTFDSHVTLVRTNGTVGKHYLNLRMYELREYFDSCKTGSTNQTELSRSIVQNVKVYIADSHTQQIFEKIEEAYHQKMMICQHQVQLLTETRDRLLPKLMNGEMEV